MKPPVADSSLRRLFLSFRSHIVLGVPVLANRLEEFGIGHDLLHHADRKWFRISLWILDGDVDLQRAEVGACEAFHHFPSARKRAPIHIQPDIVTKSDG